MLCLHRTWRPVVTLWGDSTQVPALGGSTETSSWLHTTSRLSRRGSASQWNSSTSRWLRPAVGSVVANMLIRVTHENIRVTSLHLHPHNVHKNKDVEDEVRQSPWRGRWWMSLRTMCVGTDKRAVGWLGPGLWAWSCFYFVVFAASVLAAHGGADHLCPIPRRHHREEGGFHLFSWQSPIFEVCGSLLPGCGPLQFQVFFFFYSFYFLFC